MNDIQLTCPNCGQSFAAPSHQKQAFCVYCGTMIDRSAEPDVLAAMESQPDKSALALAREAFREARFPIVNRKTGAKGDRLIELWTLLVFHSRNSRSVWGTGTARKEIGNFFEQKVWKTALELAGNDRKFLLVEQVLDSAVIYLTTCRDDSKFGSKMLGVMRMSADDIARKSAEEVCNSVIKFLLHLNKPGETEAIIHGAVMAFPRVYSSQRQILADCMQASLTDQERQEALKIVAEIAELNRR